MSKGNRYDEEFKKMIVDLYNGGKGATEISREYGVSKAMIYKWINLYTPIEESDGTVTNNDEIRKLRKELAETKEELEILKKAIAIFTRK